jgi:hypothetical protein
VRTRGRLVGGRVAVAGWQWYRWIEESSAVILVLVRTWQWQYWLRLGGLKIGREKWKFFQKNVAVVFCV